MLSEYLQKQAKRKVRQTTILKSKILKTKL